MKTLLGRVRGKSIEFLDDIGIADGQEVEVVVQIRPARPAATGAGFARTEGALADDEEWDAIMDEIRKAR